MNLSSTLAEILTGARDALDGARDRDRPLRRAMPSASAEEKLAAIYREIGETILARSLTFSAGKHGRLVIEVENRRMLRLRADLPGVLADTDFDLELGRGEDPPNDPPAALLDLLDRFARSPAAITVRSDHSELPDGLIDTGYSAEVLTRASAARADASLTAPPTPVPDTPAPDVRQSETPASRKAARPEARPAATATRLRALYETAQTFARAVAIASPEGRIRNVSGTDEQVDISAVTAAYVRQIAANAMFADAAMPPGRFIFMGSGQPDRPSFCCYADQDEILLATLDGGDPAVVLAAWAQISAAFDN